MSPSIAVLLSDKRFPPVFYEVRKREKGVLYLRPMSDPKARLKRVREADVWILT